MPETDIPELLALLDKLLSEREATAVKRFYGIGCDKEKLSEIGVTIGVSASSAGEIRRMAERKLGRPHNAARIKRMFASRAELRAEIDRLETNIGM